MYKAVTIAGVVLVLCVALGQSVTNKRAFVSGKYAIELDNVASSIHSPSGGGGYSDVVEESLAGALVTKKHIAGVQYEDITVTCGTGMSKGFYEWIKASFDHKYTRKNGSIIAADFDYKEKSRLTFTNALISEISLPALDASSKDAAKMTIKLQPESTQYAVADGGVIKVASTLQKKWLPANFRLQIDGLDCSRVNKIEALTIKQRVVADPAVGGVSITNEIPNLVITLAESSSETFYRWFDDFVIKGNNGDDKEKAGALEYLAPDLTEILFTLSFSNLGIFKLTPDKVEANSEQLRRVKVEMYCEDIKFQYGAVWALRPE